MGHVLEDTRITRPEPREGELMDGLLPPNLGPDLAGVTPEPATKRPGHVLTVNCPDVMGNVAAVYAFLTHHGQLVVESDHHTAPENNRFFMRVVFRPGRMDATPLAELEERFQADVAGRFDMTWLISHATRKKKVVLAVSKFGHCLKDLLNRWVMGEMDVEIPAIVSNHPDMEPLARWYDIPYFHLPLEKGRKADQEARLFDTLDEVGADLLVLARYMQVLSEDASDRLRGRCINIHHSFLPSFKGAKPYHQAHARGVKLIGATAHYVTSDLDEGPIIEQEIIRVDHQYTGDEMVAAGRDIESIVLGRAVRWHCEDRVFLNGSKTVVFK